MEELGSSSPRPGDAAGETFGNSGRLLLGTGLGKPSGSRQVYVAQHVSWNVVTDWVMHRKSPSCVSRTPLFERRIWETLRDRAFDRRGELPR